MIVIDLALSPSSSPEAPCEPNSTAVLRRRAQEESIAQVRHDVEEKSIAQVRRQVQEESVAQIHRQVPEESVEQVRAFSRVGSVFRRLLVDYPSDEESEQEGKSCSRELLPHPQLSAAGPAPPAMAIEGVRSTQSSQSSEYVHSPSESQEDPAYQTNVVTGDLVDRAEQCHTRILVS